MVSLNEKSGIAQYTQATLFGTMTLSKLFSILHKEI